MEISSYMGYELREAIPADLVDIRRVITEVFQNNYSIEYLHWVLENPEDPSRLNAIVALENNRIIGVSGYVRARYSTGDLLITGVHAILLCVLPEYRGGIGRELFYRVSTLSDVSLIYEGTQDAIRVYPKVGFQRVSEVEFYRLRLLPPSAAEIKPVKKKIRYIGRGIINLAQYYLSLLRIGYEVDHSLEFFPFTLALYPSYPPRNECISNFPSKETLDWLSRCPGLYSKNYLIKKGGICRGTLFVYIKDHGGFKTGKIVHIPEMGKNPSSWTGVLSFAEAFLRRQGCRWINICVHHPTLKAVLKNKGYSKLNSCKIWILDPKSYFSDKTWHLTYIEGDHGFRGV